MNKKAFKTKMFKKVRLLTLFILSTILTLTLFYNSCTSQRVENIKFSKILSSFLQDFRVEIKNGSYSTKTLNDIPVNFKIPTKNLKGEAIDYEMKISQTPDCSGGEWEPYQKETTWTFQSDEEEKLLFIYVKFREKRTKEVNYTFDTKEFEEAQGESKCIYDSIVYDTKPPENLNLSYKPAEKTNQKNAEFRFTAKDYSPIHFQCRLSKPGGSTTDLQTNSEEPLWTSCASGITYDSSSLVEEGEYTFSLRARDSSGNPSEILEYSWTIDSTAPSLIFICPNDTDSRNKPDSISIASANLTFPVSLYCKNDQEKFESCGTIGSSQATAAVKSTHSIEESLPSTTNYYKKTLNIKALDPSGNFSEPIECVWYVDTEPPTIRLTGQVPSRSYGTNTYPYIHPSPFTIRIDENEFQTQRSYAEMKIKYKVYKDDTLLTSTCNDPIDNWCEFSLNRPAILTDSNNNNNIYVIQHIYINGLEPGISTANEHTIEIQVKDTVGNNSNTLTSSWDVYGQVEESSSTQSISTTSKGKADILFVLDDSGSMRDESMVLGQSFSGIISSLSDLNWQIAVTSMEQSYQGIQNFGKLVQLINDLNNTFLEDKYILSNKQDCTLAPDALHCSVGNLSKLEDIFKRTITTGTGDNNFEFRGYQEHGIRSVNVLLDYYDDITPENVLITDTMNITQITNYRAPDLNETNAIKSFFRENSTFVVILITDQKNCGDNTPGTSYYIPCHNTQSGHPDNPDYLIEKVETIFGGSKKFIFYPIIPEYREGYNRLYPQRTDDDYWKLAKATQGRENESGTDPVIWVDVDHTTNRTPRSNGSRCSTNSNTNPIGIYTNDLCAISDDILKITTRTIQLNCPPVTTTLDTLGIHPPKYFYSSDPNYSYDPNANSNATLTPLNTGTIIENVAITISESWTNSSSTDTNRVTLEVQSGDTLPEGTYIVDYFCYSDQILLPTNTN